MRPAPTWIAELRVILVHPDGRREPGHIAVGKPYVLGDDADVAAPFESHCPIEITGFHSREQPIIGGGTLQALVLGVQFLGMMMHEFLTRGGRVLDPDDDSEVPLESIFGGLLKTAAASGSG